MLQIYSIKRNTKLLTAVVKLLTAVVKDLPTSLTPRMARECGERCDGGKGGRKRLNFRLRQNIERVDL